MARKLRVGILFGGRSGEHEVSLLSAASVLNAIDRKKFDVVPIGITKEGHWLAAADAHELLEGDSGAVAKRLRAGDPEATPGARLLQEGMPMLLAPEPGDSKALATGSEGKSRLDSQSLDVVFPVLHGTFGEDGTIQGLKDFPPDDRPDSTIIFWTFRLMVGLGVLMLLLGLGGAWLRWNGQLYQNRWFLRAAVAMGPAGLIALLAGWMTTEIGRQPWVVYDVMRTADAVAHHSALAMTASLASFVVVYVAVFGTGIVYMLKLMAIGPERHSGLIDAASGEAPQQRPARPLSAAPDINPTPVGGGT